MAQLLQERIAELRRSHFGMAGQEPLQFDLAELFSPGVAGFGDAVGGEEEDVPRLVADLHLLQFLGEMLLLAQGEADPARGERVDAAGPGAVMVQRQVAGAGQDQPALGSADLGGQGGDEIVLLQIPAQEPVEVHAEFARAEMKAVQGADDALHFGHVERGRDAFAADIADYDGDAFRAAVQVFIIVAAHFQRRYREARNFQAGHVRGLLRKRGELDAPGDFHLVTEPFALCEFFVEEGFFDGD